ncbi:hypothetical protein NEHOM01_2290 [Nematocida homosporus]|uniref:uncharacterized protein n=1 Tax=Nematocida homosporus TaxID=1912981 RepID=UPI00221EC76D|nr:uncharacterized protein NEHOM01_2290 [Nematocida homosporus]KAI5187586.1 hypothetical protein NEHOM01_2290 [Nematocida homosporus]
MPYLKTRIAVARSQVYRQNKVGCWFVLSSLLLLLDGVWGASRLSVNSERSQSSISSDATIGRKPVWRKSSKMATTLRGIGFDLGDDHETVWIQPYKPEAYGQAYYIVKCSASAINFTMPFYSNADEAKLALDRLREVAVIKTTAIRVTYRRANISCYTENLQIISRVINVVDCKNLVLYLNPNRPKNVDPDKIYLNFSLPEANSTIERAKLGPSCTLRFSTRAHKSLPNLMAEGIALVRSISTLILEDLQFEDFTFMDQLTLSDEYALYFRYLPEVVKLNFRFMHHASPRCQQISIAGPKDTKLTILGLENATMTIHPRLVLVVDWGLLQNLAMNNKATITVHELVGRATEPIPGHPSIYAPIMINAKKVVTEIAANIECGHNDFILRPYTKDICARYGIKTDSVRIYYRDDRNDMLRTLEILQKCNALAIIPKEVQERDVVCYGRRLSVPDWELQETVSFRLSQLPKWEDFKLEAQYGSKFCQAIRYKTIRILGRQARYEEQRQQVQHLIELFRCLVVDELRITNLCDDTQDNSFFLPRNLQRDNWGRSQYQLDIKLLVLDRVDNRFLYWMIKHYLFKGNIEVHILNQRFTNLNVAVLLSKSITPQISKLVLNDFFELNEIKYYNQPEKIHGFSLFKYASTKAAEGVTDEFTCLSKLFLDLGCLDCRDYDSVLTTLAAYKVGFRSASFDVYINNAITAYTKGLAAACPDRSQEHEEAWLNNKEDESDLRTLVLYWLDIKDIKIDNNERRANSQSQAEPDQLQTQSVNNLWLYFSDYQFISEKRLAIIIQWAAWRFKGLISLHLANLKVLQRKKNILASRTYWLIDQPLLKTVTLSGQGPNRTPFYLTISLYHNALLECFVSPNPPFVVVLKAIRTNPRPTYGYSLQFSYDICSDHIDNHQALIEATVGLTWNKYVRNCRRCSRIRARPTQIPRKRERKTNKVSTDENKLKAANSEHMHDTLAYLTVPYLHCQICACINHDVYYPTIPDEQRQTKDCRFIVQMLPTFIFAEGSTHNIPPKFQALIEKPIHCSQVDLYAATYFKSALASVLEKELESGIIQLVHIIST